MPKLTQTWEKLPLVEVIWLDAAINTEDEGDLSAPETLRKFGGLVLCSDVGYLISKGRREVKLAVGICREDHTYRHSNTIPRGWIRKILYLTRPEEVSNEQEAAKVPEVGAHLRPEVQ